jgi:ClpP class serine protease
MRLHEVPLLMGEDKLRIITEAVTLPLLYGQASLIDRTPAQANAAFKEFSNTQTSGSRKIHILTAFDSLVSKDVNAASGMTSYEGLSSQIDSAIASGATDIGFYLDTPGGEATGLFGLTDKIRSLPARGISTFSFADNATSAGYAIAAATQKIYASETANVGSIGAVMVHAEQSKAAEEKGITYTVFRSKELKAIGDSFTALSEAAKEKFTSSLAALDNTFNNDVVKGRPQLSVSDIISMKGASFMAEEGKALNLVDTITPSLETAIADYVKTPTTSKKGVKMSEELQAKLAEAEAKVQMLETAAAVKLEEAVQAATLAERTRCTTILSTAKTLKVSFDSAAAHIEKGYQADMSQEIMTEVAASRDANLSVDTSAGAATVHLENGEGTSKTSFLKAAYQQALGLPVNA